MHKGYASETVLLLLSQGTMHERVLISLALIDQSAQRLSNTACIAFIVIHEQVTLA
jgi:hypothetical protein